MFLLKQNEEVSKDVVTELENLDYKQENGNIWVKNTNKKFDILFNSLWFTFALRLTDEKYKNEAERILNCPIFNKYALRAVEYEPDKKWVHRNFYYPDARASKDDIVKNIVNAFKKLEKCITCQCKC